MSQQKRLTIVLCLNLAMIAGLVMVGLSSHSLGVLAAGGDYIADSAAIGLGLFAIYMSKPPHNHPKATSYVAFINALFLLVITVLVVYGSLQRLVGHTPVIEGLSVLIISIIAALVMLVGAFILAKGEDTEEDLHMRSVMLDTISDAASAAAVAIAGLIIFLTKSLYWLDSVVALLVGLVIGYNAIKLLRDVIKELKEN